MAVNGIEIEVGQVWRTRGGCDVRTGARAMTEATNDEQEFLNYVNATPKQHVQASVHLEMPYQTEMSVGDFIAHCHKVWGQIAEPLRGDAVVVVGDDDIEFRACREETPDEHIAHCRAQFDNKRRAQANRRLMYEQLKKEFGDA